MTTAPRYVTVDGDRSRSKGRQHQESIDSEVSAARSELFDLQNQWAKWLKRPSDEEIIVFIST